MVGEFSEWVIAAEQEAVDCGEWNIESFFRSASVGAVALYLAAGADTAARTEGGYTPLHHGSWYNRDPSVIEALLAAGTAGSDDGPTPLHSAAYGNMNPTMVEVLLFVGADVTARLETADDPARSGRGKRGRHQCPSSTVDSSATV